MESGQGFGSFLPNAFPNSDTSLSQNQQWSFDISSSSSGFPNHNPGLVSQHQDERGEVETWNQGGPALAQTAILRPTLTAQFNGSHDFDPSAQNYLSSIPSLNPIYPMTAIDHDSGYYSMPSENPVSSAGVTSNLNRAEDELLLLKDSDKIDAVWHGMLSAFYYIIGCRQPTELELHHLHGLTTLLENALRSWFSSHSLPLKSSATFDKAGRNWSGMLFAFYFATGCRSPNKLELHCLQSLTDLPEAVVCDWFQEQVPSNTFSNGDSQTQLDPLLLSLRQQDRASPDGRLPALTKKSRHVAFQSLDRDLGASMRKKANDTSLATDKMVRSGMGRKRNATPTIPESLLRLIFHEIRQREAVCAEGNNQKAHERSTCELGCGKQFDTNYTRNRHENERFPECFWFCTVCGDAHNAKSRSLFTRKDKFKKHLMRHVSKGHISAAVELRYVLDNIPIKRPCGLCGDQISVHDMLRHLKKQHLEKGAVMENWRVWPAPKKLKGSEGTLAEESDGNDDSDDGHGDDQGGEDNDDQAPDQGRGDENNYSPFYHGDVQPPPPPPPPPAGGSSGPNWDPNAWLDFSPQTSFSPASASLFAPKGHLREVLLDFERKIKTEWTPRAVYGRRFVQVGHISSWMGDRLTQTSLTNCAMLLSTSHSLNSLEETAQIVQSEYLRVFSILLTIGYGDSISNFIEAELDDRALPLLNWSDRRLRSLRHWAGVEGKESFLNKFFERQWAFCPGVLGSNCVEILSPNKIVPFVSKEVRNKKGAFGTVYEVEIIPEFRLLSSPSSSLPIHSYVLKVFQGKYRASWENEVRNLSFLRDSLGTINFYGCYTQMDEQTRELKHNILLERAESDLDEYFADTPSPFSTAAKQSLWKQCLGLTKALRFIHNIDVRGEQYAGAHLDLKPSNILVMPGNGWKISDFGCSIFKRKKNKVDWPETYPGTRAYAPPECLGENSTVVSPSLKPQAADIWSFGCVMSEIATWSLQGWYGLEEFRERRKGHSKLASESAWHSQLLLLKDHASDKTTLRILDLITSNMLVYDPDKRSNALECFNNFSEILKSSGEDDLDALEPPPPPGSRECSAMEKGPYDQPDLEAMECLGNKESSVTSPQARKPPESMHSFLSMPFGRYHRGYNMKPKRVNNFHDRDFIILVDNSTSMQEHWDDVTTCVELLSQFLLPFNDGRIDLRFTMDTKTCSTGSVSSKLNWLMKSKAPASTTRPTESKRDQMGTALSENLCRYLAGRQTKNTTVFILTDGLWNPGNDVLNNPVANVISSFSKLRRHQRNMGTVRFQYVNFIRSKEKPRYLKTPSGSELINVIPASLGIDTIMEEPLDCKREVLNYNLEVLDPEIGDPALHSSQAKRLPKDDPHKKHLKKEKTDLEVRLKVSTESDSWFDTGMRALKQLSESF